MVKAIVRDPLFLAQKSVPATEEDRQVVQDLLDTLRANLDRCVGMAANMIGVRKNIIVVAMGPFQFAMINPVITLIACLSRIVWIYFLPAQYSILEAKFSYPLSWIVTSSLMLVYCLVLYKNN